jgi:hypothetical protein
MSAWKMMMKIILRPEAAIEISEGPVPAQKGRNRWQVKWHGSYRKFGKLIL